MWSECNGRAAGISSAERESGRCRPAAKFTRNLTSWVYLQTNTFTFRLSSIQLSCWNNCLGLNTSTACLAASNHTGSVSEAAAIVCMGSFILKIDHYVSTSFLYVTSSPCYRLHATWSDLCKNICVPTINLHTFLLLRNPQTVNKRWTSPLLHKCDVTLLFEALASKTK